MTGFRWYSQDDPIVDPDTGAKVTPACNSAPGICPFLRCKWNLLTDTRPNGTLVVPHEEGFGITLANKRTNEGTVAELAQAVALTYEDDPITEAVIARADYLWDLVGTSCTHDLTAAGMDLNEVGRVLGVSRERARQEEFAAKRKAKRDRKLQQHAEDNGLLYQIRKRPRAA